MRLRQDQKTLRHIKPLQPEDIIEIWRSNEEHLDHWQKYLQSKNYASWGDWRKEFFDRFRCQYLDWHLYEVVDPKNTIQQFRGGPFKGWANKFYKGQKAPTFEELISNFEVWNYQPIRDFLGHLAKTDRTTITGLETKDGIVIIEGMHRCTAVALAKLENLDFNTAIFLAKASFIGDLPEIVGGAEDGDEG